MTDEQHPGSTSQDFDTVVIGGGQTGLTIGYYLAQQDRNFIIVNYLGGKSREIYDFPYPANRSAICETPRHSACSAGR